MDYTDRKIFTAELTKRIGSAIHALVEKYDVTDTIMVEAIVDTPAGYVDDKGNVHGGRLITVFVDFDEDYDDDE